MDDWLHIANEHKCTLTGNWTLKQMHLHRQIHLWKCMYVCMHACTHTCTESKRKWRREHIEGRYNTYYIYIGLSVGCFRNSMSLYIATLIQIISDPHYAHNTIPYAWVLIILVLVQYHSPQPANMYIVILTWLVSQQSHLPWWVLYIHTSQCWQHQISCGVNWPICLLVIRILLVPDDTYIPTVCT